MSAASKSVRRRGLNLGKTNSLKLAKSSQAVIFFQRPQSEDAKISDKSYGVELVLSHQALADAHCKPGEFAEAIKALNRCLALDVGDCQDQVAPGSSILGDGFSLMGSEQGSITGYHFAKQAHLDRVVAETCRFLARSHLQAMELERAEEVSKELLKIHERSSDLFLREEEFSDRNLMALIASARGDHKSALRDLQRAASIIDPSQSRLDWASIQACIGDTLASLGRFKDADIAYHTALEIFTRIEGEGHAAVGSVYLSLADLRLKLGNVGAARIFCERASRIYDRTSEPADALVSGLVEAAGIYESLGEIDHAVALLQRALRAVEEEEHNLTLDPTGMEGNC
ncbi:protein KINESIN LIGHT CHAIN-RELATED 2 [Selaginella moellendorffii]|uniref:protein KINESIN LIGHT CHAIN-RELATED 2 n=1 Tax=Selaginella moellendorffii TaxID=88036 RepID=UPI000D1CCAEF|nr:protein KINESIN LIGHT CHAIN-RELATED 2 [Selaginella moellendorffii]|eukprot:XP_002993216.2 protein KINESIN LIGHT CHAIN-RELATED 2 [Selaginella moellendorffii]